MTHALTPIFRPLALALLTAILVAPLGPASAQAREPSAENFAPCLTDLRDEAKRAGVSNKAYDQFTQGLSADLSVLKLLDDQPEFRTPIWDYLAALVDEQRVSDGKAKLDEWRDTLKASAARYGVEPDVVVAVWGVESDFGRSFGKRPLLNSLGTLSCFGRRQSYFRGEFFSLLNLLERGDVRPENLVGSWAGAFGHTQFMPSTYQRLAVDADGDGRRDLVDSVPDALASTANFLAKAGWKPGRPWGFEVKLPAGFDAAMAGRKNKHPASEWIARGVQRADGAPLSEAGLGQSAILLPAGPKGPAFLVTTNFDAIYGYDAAESYALAIAHLSDRLRGGSVFITPWPTDDAGLSRVERREVQTLLTQRGHAIGDIDGMLGAASRAAIKVEQQRLGWTPDGRAGQKLLRTLKSR